jgi:hypothetical protein
MQVPINKIKPNPKNPRTIKDERFEKLKKSIQDFPDMLNKRPLVCFTDTDGKFVVLGGNMRLKAAKDLGLKELPIILADEWTEEQKAEFLIKDNVGFGEWDWNELNTDWDTEQLNEWGLDVPNWSKGLDVNSMDESELDMSEEFDPIGKAGGLQRVVFIFDGPEEAESYLNNLGVKFEKRNMAWQVNLNTPFTS